MFCPKCGSSNVQVQAISRKKRRGCFGILLTIVLFWIWWVFGLIRLLRGRKNETVSMLVCQNCGYTERIKRPGKVPAQQPVQQPVQQPTFEQPVQYVQPVEAAPVEPAAPREKTYLPTGVVIMLLAVFFPVGIPMMWAKTKWPLWLKLVITGFFVIVTVAIGAANAEPIEPSTITAARNVFNMIF